MLSLVSAIVPIGGTSIDLTFTGGAGFSPVSPATGITGFTIKIDGNATLVTALIRTANTVITAFFSRPAYTGDPVTVAATSANLVGADAQTLADFTAIAATNNSTQINPDAGVAWYYSNQTLVGDDISAAGLRIATNMENTSDTTNTARLLRQGQYADAIMDGRLRAFGFTTPLSLDDDTDANILQGISNAIVIAQLCRWRVLQVSAGDGMNSYTTITKLGSNFWDYADNMLTEIGYGRFMLKATRSQQAPGSNAGAFDIRGLPLYPQTPPGFAYPMGLVSVPPW